MRNVKRRKKYRFAIKIIQLYLKCQKHTNLFHSPDCNKKQKSYKSRIIYKYKLQIWSPSDVHTGYPIDIGGCFDTMIDNTFGRQRYIRNASIYFHLANKFGRIKNFFSVKM